MFKYAILLNPGHNRVYFEESIKLSENELSIALSKTSLEYSDIKEEIISGINYITFISDKKIDGDALLILSRLSFSYAIFEVSEALGQACFIPVEMPDYRYIDSGISTILKYTGKTNELFTRMMINIAHFSSDFKVNEKIKLLDPIAGKGTTLFEGIICGYDVYGIEIGEKPVFESVAYFKKYLETEKYKHEQTKDRISGENKSFTSPRYTFTFARTKEEYKSDPKTFEMISGNSLNIRRFYKKNSFNLIVGDLPYGVQHGNVTNEKQSSLTRNPEELLNACLPLWSEVLIPGGTIVLAWNTLILPREKMKSIIEKHNLSILENPIYENFAHRVDNSIKRDIIAAKKRHIPTWGSN